MADEDDMDGPDPDAVATGWLSDSLPTYANLALVLGQVDYFRNIDLAWDETLSLSGEACGFTSDVVYDLKDWLEGIPDAQDAVTEKSVELFFAEWRTRFLRRVLCEAEALKSKEHGERSG